MTPKRAPDKTQPAMKVTSVEGLCLNVCRLPQLQIPSCSGSQSEYREESKAFLCMTHDAL